MDNKEMIKISTITIGETKLKLPKPITIPNNLHSDLAMIHYIILKLLGCEDISMEGVDTNE